MKSFSYVWLNLLIMNEKYPLKVLDDILLFLFESDNHKSFKIEVKDFVEKRNFIFNKNTSIVLDKIADNIFGKERSLKLFNQRTDEAIFYLCKNNFMSLNGEELSLTYEGIIQHHKGFVNTLDLKMINDRRLQNVEDENLKIGTDMVRITQEMSKTNKSIRKLTLWIVLGALVAMIYQAVELLKTFFPNWF